MKRLTKTFWLGLACGITILALIAAVPALTDFNTNQFSTAGNAVALKSGVALTNAINQGNFTVNSAGLQVFLMEANTGDLYALGSLHVRQVDYTWPSSQGAAGTVLQNDGTGVLSWQPAGAGDVTNTYNTVNITNLFNFKVARGGSIIITNYVQFPYTTLTMTGTNVSAMNLTNGSAFRLLMTTNAYIDTPSNFPTTNYLQTVQLFVQQSAAGLNTLTFNTNTFKFPDETPPTQSTNANAVNVYTFVTHPFSNSILISIQTARYQ